MRTPPLSACAGALLQVRARIGALWRYLRRVSGDDAYERYVEHLRSCHPDATPLSAGDFYRRRHEEKWSRPSRCC